MAYAHQKTIGQMNIYLESVQFVFFVFKRGLMNEDKW